MGDEVKMLTALKGGSERAFERLYKQLSGKLYNFIMTLSKGDEYIAEEIVQATFVKLWEIREQVDPQRSIHSFLSVIAKNMLMNRYQRQTVEFVYLEYLQKQGLSSDSTTEKEIDGKSLAGTQKDIPTQQEAGSIYPRDCTRFGYLGQYRGDTTVTGKEISSRTAGDASR